MATLVSRRARRGPRRTRRYTFLALLLLALAAPAGLSLARDAKQPYVIVFDRAAVSKASDDGRQIDPEAVLRRVRQVAVAAHLSAVGEVYTSALGGFSAKLTPQQASEIAADPSVSSVLPDEPVSAADDTLDGIAGRVRTTTNPTDRVQPGVRRVGARSSRILGVSAASSWVNADVAIIDTGIETDHPDLNVVGGYNCTGRNRDRWGDRNGHGTHVAGIVGALDNRFGVTGVAPGARLWSVKVLDRHGHGYLSWVVCGVDWVTAQRDHGRPLIEVANMSLSFNLRGANDAACGEASHDMLHMAICRSVAAGTVYVAAAGNDSHNARRNRPAAYDEVITVSALADYDGRGGGRGRPSACPYWSPEADDAFARFSNYGQDIDLIAPGKCVLSTYIGKRYAWMSGTSMAAPHVSGAVAIYRAMFPRATPAQVRMALQAVGRLDWRTATDPDRNPEKALWIGAFRAVPDFALAASIADGIVTPGTTTRINIAITRVGGFSDPISVELVKAPAGVRASSTATRRGATSIAVRLPKNMLGGRYSLTVRAEAGSVVHLQTVSLFVRSGAPIATFLSPAAQTMQWSRRIQLSWTERASGAPIT